MSAMPHPGPARAISRRTVTSLLIAAGAPWTRAEAKNRFKSADAAEPRPYLLRDDAMRWADEMAGRRGLDAEWTRQAVGQAVFLRQVPRLMLPPARGTAKNWRAYRSRFVEPLRIRAGVRFWQRNRGALAQAQAEFGVPPEIIVAIIGVETSYGRITGRYRVLDALATLGFDYPPRGEYFRGELEQFLLLARRNGIDPLAVRGSYAGAMGLPQFMPRSYLSYAVDGDLDGRSDLWGSVDDAMSSIANYLGKHGWQAGAPLVVPATLVDPDAEGLVAGSLTANRSVGELRRLGLIFDPALGDDVPALLVGVRGTDGPEYRVGLRNLAVIMRYNRSPMYALAVHELGSRIEAALPPSAPPGTATVPAPAAPAGTSSGAPL